MWFIFLISLCPREVETQIIQLEALEAPTALGALVVAREMLAVGPQQLEIPPVVVALTHLESEDISLKIKKLKRNYLIHTASLFDPLLCILYN